MSIETKSYTLREEGGAWLGQVVLTSDGMFSAVTDYGNMSFAWRSIGNGRDFREFMSNVEMDYFSRKMYLSNADAYSKMEKAMRLFCDRFAEKILPPLQEVLKNELELGIGWSDKVVLEGEVANG